jgi:hypothetical protein
MTEGVEDEDGIPVRDENAEVAAIPTSFLSPQWVYVE